MIERTQPKERLSSEKVNALIDFANGQAPRDPSKAGTLLAIFELKQLPQIPDGVTEDQPTCPWSEGARQVWLLPADDTYGGTTLGSDWTIYFPTISSSMPGLPYGVGARLVCWFNPQSRRWEAISLNELEIAFELSEAKAPGNDSVAAYARPWSGTAYETDTDMAITVYDPLNKWRGRAKDAYSSPHDAGSRGFARWNWLTQRLEITDMQPHATMISGAATAAFTAANSTITIDGVSVMQLPGAIITNTDPAGNVTVTNDTGFASDNDAIVKAVWNEASTRYEIFDAPCPA